MRPAALLRFPFWVRGTVEMLVCTYRSIVLVDDLIEMCSLHRFRCLLRCAVHAFAATTRYVQPAKKMLRPN